MSIEATSIDPPRDIAHLLDECLTKYSRYLRRLSPSWGITPERLSALGAINAHGPVSVSALADIERVRPATMSRMISVLVDDGFAKRRDDKNDRRGVLISATSKGRRVHERASQRCLEEFSVVLGTLDREQLAAMRAVASLLSELTSELDRGRN